MTDNEESYRDNEERVLVFLPESLDGESTLRVLKEIGLASKMCRHEELCAEIGIGAGALIIEEEALTPGIRFCLHETLASQPSWSVLPVIVLLRRGPETKSARDALELPGDVILIERPVRVNTLVAVIRSALRSRHSQYMVRDQLVALEQSQSRYRTLFNSIDEGFCIIEIIFDENQKPIDYCFVETNPSFERQTGLVNAQGKRMRELIPQLEDYWFEIYGQIALTGVPNRFVNQAEQLHAWYDVYAFRFGGPEDRQVAVLFNDITERKRTEAEIEKLNKDLAARAAELDSANRELEAFGYTVAHDLRKPLTVINGYCQAILELCGEQLDEQCRIYVKEAYEGTWRMDQLITALLNFSKITHAEPKREEIDLGKLAEEVFAELKQAEPERRVILRIKEGLEAEADPVLMRIVLANLIGNAWKYTGTREEGVIEFGAAEINENKVFFVRDNGVGFDMADADKLFNPFQRLAVPDEIRGIGIGLATVKRIIKRHHGNIWAEGEPGKGATFYFTLSHQS